MDDNIGNDDPQLTGLARLNKDLGIVTDDNILMPPPLDSTEANGVDALGQPIIDGSTDDNTPEVPGLEEFAGIIADTIDPLDTESLTMIDEDMENSMKVVNTAEATAAAVGTTISEIEEQGGIAQGDLDEVISIHPGMEEYVRPLYASTPKMRTKTNYAAGIEALTTGQKVLVGGAMAAILAIITKIILVVLRVMGSRAAMNTTKYAKALRTPDDMRRYQEAIDRQIQDIVGKVKDNNKFGAALAKILKDKTNFVIDTQTIIKNGGGVCEALFAQSMRNRYFTLYDILAGKPQAGIDFAKATELFHNTPGILEKYAATLNNYLNNFIKAFNEDKILDVKDYIIPDDAFAYSNITTADKSTGMARQAQLLRSMSIRIDDPKIHKMGDYVRNVIDLTQTIKTTSLIAVPVKDALKKIQELQGLVSALKTSGRADIRDNRTAILKQLQIQEANFSQACVGLESSIAAYVDLLAESQKIMDDTVKVYQQAFNFHNTP